MCIINSHIELSFNHWIWIPRITEKIFQNSVFHRLKKWWSYYIVWIRKMRSKLTYWSDFIDLFRIFLWLFEKSFLLIHILSCFYAYWEEEEWDFSVAIVKQKIRYCLSSGANSHYTHLRKSIRCTWDETLDYPSVPKEIFFLNPMYVLGYLMFRYATWMNYWD